METTKTKKTKNLIRAIAVVEHSHLKLFKLSLYSLKLVAVSI